MSVLMTIVIAVKALRSVGLGERLGHHPN